MSDIVSNCSGKMELVKELQGGTHIFECPVCHVKISKEYSDEPEHPEREASYFQLTLHPAEEDDLKISLELNHVYRYRFWHYDYCWSMFWNAGNIADTAEKILKGEEVFFGNLTGSYFDTEFLRFKKYRWKKDKVVVELLNKEDLLKKRLLESIVIDKDEAVFQLARCFSQYIEYLYSNGSASDSTFGYTDHSLWKNPNIVRIFAKKGINLPSFSTKGDKNIDDFEESFQSLISKLSSMKINTQDTKKIMPFILTMLKPGEQKILARILKGMVEFDDFKDVEEAFDAILKGKVKLSFGEKEENK